MQGLTGCHSLCSECWIPSCRGQGQLLVQCIACSVTQWFMAQPCLPSVVSNLLPALLGAGLRYCGGMPWASAGRPPPPCWMPCLLLFAGLGRPALALPAGGAHRCLTVVALKAPTVSQLHSELPLLWAAQRAPQCCHKCLQCLPARGACRPLVRPLLQVVYNYLGSVLSEIKNVTNLDGGLRPTEVMLPGKSSRTCAGSWWLLVMIVPCLLGCYACCCTCQ